MKRHSALMSGLLFLSFRCLTSPSHAQFVPAAGMKGETFTARSAPATVSRHSDEALKKQGYALIGDISLKEADGEPCWGENCSASLSCAADRRKKDVTRKLLEQAAAHGGDVVILSKDNTTFKDSVDTKGKCLEKGPVIKTVQVMKCQSARRESTGAYNPGNCHFEPKTITAYECTRWGTISGAQCSVASAGAVWRFEPDLPKRIAERAMVKTYVEDPGGMKRVRQNDKWGYEDENGKTIAQPQFDRAWPFAEGLARVEIGGKHSYLDKAGALIISPELDDARDFSEGFAAVMIGKRWGYIDTKGQYAVKPQFYEAKPFADGFAAVYDGLHWGYIDKTGQWVIRPSEFEDAKGFSGGLAPVKKYVEERAPPTFTTFELRERWGYINKDGVVVIKFIFQEAFGFSEDLAVVKLNGDYGYINKAGEVVVKGRWAEANAFVNGKAKVRIGSEELFIDKSGRVVPP